MLNSIKPCSSRRPGEAVGACRAVRRTSRCDRAVVVLQDRFRVSQRRACRLTGQNRNTQRRPVPLADIEEQKLRSRIRKLARSHVRWGRRLGLQAPASGGLGGQSQASAIDLACGRAAAQAETRTAIGRLPNAAEG